MGDDETGRVLAGRYRLRELIGRGGMGSVWRASDELLGRDVALKQVQLRHLPAVEAERALDRTMREARIAAALHHPNIVTVFDVLTEDGLPWLVMEHLPSRSLRSLLADRGTLAPQEAAFIGVQVAAALAAAHEAGVVHRDVTPDNILIAAAGLPAIGPHTVVKLADFGISLATTAQTVTATEVVSGTPAYFAPETARGEGTGPRTDVYSLGATLFAALDGSPPFSGDSENVLALLTRIARGGVPAPRRAGHLTGIVQALTADDPRARPTAAQAHAALRSLATREAPAAPVTRVDAIPRVGAGRRAGRWVAIGAGILALAAAAAVAVLVVLPADRDRGDAAAPGPSTTPQPAAAPAVDPETADPCSLIDRGALAVHGTVAVHPDVSAFTVCDAAITGADGRDVFLTASFDNANQRPYGVGDDLERVGQLTVARREVLGTCERRILFPDGTGASISVKVEEGAGTDACAVAETGIRAALGIVTHDGIGTRVPLQSRTALAGIDACSLLGPADVEAALPGVEGTGGSGFGGWSCTWLKAAGPRLPALTVVYAHWFPLSDEDGRAVDIGGRAGRVAEQPGRVCAVTIPQRVYDANGQDRLETATLTGFGDDPQLCAHVIELANRLVPRLPPMS